MFFVAEFWLFVLVVLILYSLVNKALWQNLIVLAASYIVYAVFSREFLVLLLLLTAISYGIGYLLNRATRYRRIMLWTGIVLNLAALIAFKYVLPPRIIADLLKATPNQPITAIVIPLGISFYIFRILSYLFDVFNRRTAPGSPLEFAVYITFFPQIVAGPIERATNFLPRLKARRVVTQEQIVVGLTYIFAGFFYKIVIADPLSLSTDKAFAAIDTLTPADALAHLILFSVRLYADFAGYSAIAIGISHLFALPAMENFREPYFSTSIVEFWTRWHISLSSWIRDYIFFPVSRFLIRRFGTRYGFFIQNITMFFTMLLIGLWHGLSWPFVAWGVLHGTYMIAEHLVKRIQFKRMPKFASQAFDVLGFLPGLVITQFLVAIGWIFFGAKSLADASAFFSTLFTPNYTFSATWWPHVLTPVILLLLIDGIKSRGLRSFWTWNLALRVAVLTAMVIAILLMNTTSYAPFIYQNF